MPCSLTKGFSIDCRDSVGGLKSVYFANFANVSSFTESGGEVTAITQATGTSFYQYNLEKENGNFETTVTSSVENGTTFYETILTFSIKKMIAATSEELRLLALDRLAIIIEDNNGKYWAMGFDRGSDLQSGTQGSGQAFGDMNGYSLTFRSIESSGMPEVQSAVVSGLTTA